LHRCGVKGVHALAAWRIEAEMQVRLAVRRNRTVGSADPERDAVASVAEGACALAQARIPERLQRGVVEALGLGSIANAVGDMIKQCSLPLVSDWGRCLRSDATCMEIGLQLPRRAAVGGQFAEPTERFRGRLREPPADRGARIVCSFLDDVVSTRAADLA